MRGHVSLFLRGLLHGIIKGRRLNSLTHLQIRNNLVKRLCTQTKYCSFSLGGSDLKELGKRIHGQIGRHYDESAYDNLQKKWDLNQTSSTDPTGSNSASGRTHPSPSPVLKILNKKFRPCSSVWCVKNTYIQICIFPMLWLRYNFPDRRHWLRKQNPEEVLGDSGRMTTTM